MATANNNNNNNSNNDLLSVFPYNGSSRDKTTTTISKEIVLQLNSKTALL